MVLGVHFGTCAWSIKAVFRVHIVHASIVGFVGPRGMVLCLSGFQSFEWALGGGGG